jgi:hypothetical protein
MLRKLVLAAVLATGTLTGLAGVSTVAEAHPPVRDFRHGLEVLHRCGWRWEVYDHFLNRFEPERAASFLRHRGEIVEMRPC